MKKASVFALGGGVIAIGFGISILLFVPKEKIQLYIEDNQITWKDKSDKNTLGSKYYIYNDDFLVNKVTEQNYILPKEKLIDEEGPEKVSKVNINYTEKNIYFNWEEVKDLGTDNKIWVSLYNEQDKQISYSNTVNKNYASGVYKYIVDINGEEFEIYDEREFTVKREDLSNGITMTKLYSIDNRGNKSNITNIPLYNYNVVLSKEDNILRYHIDDNTQQYKYKAYINGEDKGFVASSEELNSLLMDKAAPSPVDRPCFVIKDKKANITWEKVVDKGTDYLVRVESYGLTYYNTAYSDDITINKTSDIKGYFYMINKSNKYVLTNEDKFTERTDIDFEGDYGTYYIHLATLDNAGNLSKTNTYMFEIKDPSINNTIIEDYNGSEDNINNSKPNGGHVSNNNGHNSGNNSGNSNNNSNNADDSNSNIETDTSDVDAIHNMLITKGDVSTGAYNKAVDMLDRVSLDLLKKMDNMGIKIYITSGEAEDLYVSLMGKSLDESISGIFVWNIANPFVIVESAYLDSTLLHEIGHVIDYISGNGKFISEEDTFVNIYQEEKDILFVNNEYVKKSSKEYFAESYNLFCNNPYSLKTKALKTYEYLKEIK